MKNRETENSQLTELETKGEKKPSWKFKIWFLIFIFALGSFVFYQFSLQPPSQLTREESAEQLEKKNKTSILDIFSFQGLEVGNLAPDFISEDVYGNRISLRDFQGKKPVLLVFWATWCGYCTKELPELKAFTQEHQDEIQVIAVDSGESKETLQNYIQEKNVNFLMVLDEDRKIWNQYLVRGTPSHFLINKEGKIVSLRPGLASKENLETMLMMLK